MKKKLVAIIPCYNVGKYCENLITDCLNFVKQAVVVDDGSTDQTPFILNKIKTTYPNRIHIITFPKNQGKGFAILAGLKYAKENLEFEAILTIDADGQHDPSQIPKLVEPILKGADFVIGERSFNQMPTRSRFGNRWISFLLRLMYGFAPIDNQSGFRAFSPFMANELVEKMKGGRYETELLCLLEALSNGHHLATIPISTVYIDNNASSHFSPLKDSIRILNVFFKHLLGLK